MSLNFINKPIIKKDALSLVTGKPVYLEDVIPENCLIVKVLRSPYANAIIKDIKKDIALKVDGIECIYTYEDVPNKRFTMAGQTYPEPSPYDRLILDKHLRYIGDAVAIVAGINEKCVDKALKLIKVEYDILEPLIDFRKAKDSDIIIHPEDNWKALCDVGADNKRNICASDVCIYGDVEKVFKECDMVFEKTYHTKANNQAMMETFRTYCYIDTYGRLNVLSSTQIVFHARRILSNALDIPKSKIRVSKPRIGGGFGAKQSIIAEIFPAFVTWKTKKASKIIFSREESQIASTPRHEMEMNLRIGVMNNGIIRAIDLYTLSNTGAYGEHGPTTVGLSGHKSIPLYGKVEAFKFSYDVVYTNVMSSGAYRGYGATQGIFALESAINEISSKINIDPVKIREINMVREGQVMPAYYNEKTDSCALDRCLERAKKLIDWDNKYPYKVLDNGKIRSVGVAMAMQGSGIPNIDVGSATIKINDDGFYTLLIGSADMGTGCDTILSQIAAEVLKCDINDINVFAADTDSSPYDSGSYASSTTYITGNSVIKACEKLINIMRLESAKLFNDNVDNIDFDGKRFFNSFREISIVELVNKSQCGSTTSFEATISYSSSVSPPPFMVGMVEIEIDKETGFFELIDFVAVVDCGTPINSNLAKVQVEGGLVQGIGMAIFENIQYNKKGRLYNNSFMQYKLPTRIDIGRIRVEFENSYEKTGPYGAKSIGEIVINTPSPAIANAIYNATGIYLNELPLTPEKIIMSMINKQN